ncbi:CRISPR-associated protein, Cse2 family [Haloechinothrix alba]|uniref:CRISPR-associated protein, Cse2 family n=1 Tax=Haloechinothrix alba TaxID=664784 RepID=A0A238ZL21_9PSEU|nr:type I-E CRISPR-associated protein Cse2/CasB [Haloechinothrix alba]SNR83761.1 CRISPR-associated protein, Cse2 family [Haloechinothrix alba]
MTNVTPAVGESPRRRERRLGPLGSALERRIEQLQSEYLQGAPAARADLARLRRGLGKPAGSVPEIWPLTVGLVPESLVGDDDEPSRAEQAAHATLTLFALHQQSASRPVHRAGYSFGRAVGHLARSDSASTEAVTRRFMAVATAESIDEVLTHVRGLITQIKAAELAMDYSRFAEDVSGLLTPGRQTDVRLAWGRDFYRTTGDSVAEDASDSDSANASTDSS